MQDMVGADSGSVSNNRLEKDYTLKSAKYINERLGELGISSVLTRDDDSVKREINEPPVVVNYFYHEEITK